MRRPLLVERERELAELAALLGRARGGDGGVAVVRGPAGIGKTALLDAAAADASGFRVLRGRCGEVERELSFGLVRDLLVPAVRGAPPALRRRWFSGAARGAAAVLGEAPEAPVDPISAMYGLYWLLATIAEERPVLLVADDVHWSDDPSLRWLVYLARRVDGLPVALLAASRPAQSGDPGRDALLGAVDGVLDLRLALLTLRGTGEVIASRMGMPPAADFTRACQAAAGGNPWLLGELLGALGEAGVDVRGAGVPASEALASERLRSGVLGRVRRLGSVAMSLATAVAVLGDGCRPRVAADLAEVDEESATAAVSALVAAGVLADRPGLAFAHPLVRDAVYLDVPAAVRAHLHARAAARLAAGDADAASIASQLLVAAPVGEPWALAALGKAAQTAMARGAPRSAVAFLRRALAERPPPPTRGELLRMLGNALARLGDPEAFPVLEEALDLTDRPADRVAVVEASTDGLSGSGRVDEARRLLVATLAGEQRATQGWSCASRRGWRCFAR